MSMSFKAAIVCKKIPKSEQKWLKKSKSAKIFMIFKL